MVRKKIHHDGHEGGMKFELKILDLGREATERELRITKKIKHQGLNGWKCTNHFGWESANHFGWK